MNNDIKNNNICDDVDCFKNIKKCYGNEQSH